MWIVKLALDRPYTFVVFALLIVVLGAAVVRTTPTDIFPFIDIPTISVVWQYQGLSTKEMEERVTTYSEYSISSNVDNIQRIESTTLNGISITKVYFQPQVKIEEAMAQVTAVSQSIRIIMPPGINPPFIFRYNASDVPILQVALGSQSLSESELYDFGLYRIRQQVATVPGAVLPLPFGGKARRILVDLDTNALTGQRMTPNDVSAALLAQNLTLPTGNIRVGPFDYEVAINSMPGTIEELNDLPVRQVNGATLRIRDIGQAHDGSEIQRNMVRVDGKRAALVTILKSGTASTLDVVDRVRSLQPTLKGIAPPGLELSFLADQSVFVREAIQGVLEEGLIAAGLTAIMILVFLGSWRSTLIVATSIPLSILVSLLVLGALGHTINVMTLGGLALAIGILVDDATVEIENIHRNLAMKKKLTQAILDGAQEIALPAFVATLAICIVFVPVTLLTGPSKFLFTPMALAVVFAVATSYLLSRTIVPTMVKYLLPAELSKEQRDDEAEDKQPGRIAKLRARVAAAFGSLFHRSHRAEPAAAEPSPEGEGEKRGLLGRMNEKFEHWFDHRLKRGYQHGLCYALNHRKPVFALVLLLICSSLALVPFVGRDFFPAADAGQLRLHVRATPGLRLEETERIFRDVDAEIRKLIPPHEIEMLIDNLGVPQPTTLGRTDNANISVFDGEIQIVFKPEHEGATHDYRKLLRERLPKRFPECAFFFQAPDIPTQILNFGLPAPIDIQLSGRNREANYKLVKEIERRIRTVPGAVDVRTHQIIDAPALLVNIDRIRASQLGMTQQQVANNVLSSLASSYAVSPGFWTDPAVGNPYPFTAQTPPYRFETLDELRRTALTAANPTAPAQLLSNLATIERRPSTVVANHVDVQPTFDIYADVQDRDLGGVAADISKILEEFRPRLTADAKLSLRGQVESMNSAFTRLLIGMILALLLVYALMVVNFQSWTDPFIIIMALSGAFSGIVWMLWATQTTFSIPSLMGAMMCIGVATSNSILLVTFANEQLAQTAHSLEAAYQAGSTRLRPVMMTALAMILGMLPMSLGLGGGGEMNAPLGRAVIGGLLLATFATLFFVPVVFSMLRRAPAGVEVHPEPQENKPK